MTTLLEATKSLGALQDWLDDWLQHGEPTLTGRDAEIVAQCIERRRMRENEYVNDLAQTVNRTKRGKQELLEALKKAKAIFDFEFPLNLGERWKREILRFLTEKETEIKKDDDDLRSVELELERLREAAKWTRVSEAEPARVRI